MPAAHRDYYAILDIPHDADDQTIKRAFRKLAFQYHPDRNQEPGAEECFKEIAEAYAVLSDPVKRAAFDGGEARGVSVSAADDIFSDIDFSDLFSGLGFDFAGQGLFSSFMRQRRRTRASRGANLEVTLDISLQRVATGGEEIFHLKRATVCRACHGSGAQPGTQPQHCPTCRGHGERLQRWRDGGLIMQQIVTCATCHGRGRVYTVPCSTCHGQGFVEHEEPVAISIPVGVEDGMVLRVPGQGLPSREPGGVPGDLFVVLHIQSDDRFERRGIDLWQTVTISVEDSVLGTQVDIPTLQELFRLTLAAGTQPETVLCLRQYGLPEFGGHSRGDMFVRVHVYVPERLSREERALYESLRHLKQGTTRPSHRRRSMRPMQAKPETAPHGLKAWLAKLWHRIDSRVRQWLQADEAI